MQQIKLNGNDMRTTYGIYVVKGGYDILVQPPKRKDIYSHSWNDENGTDREISEAYFESKSIALPLVLIASSIDDYKTNFEAFNTVVTGAARFNLDIVSLDRRFPLLFDSISDMKFYQFSDSKVLATFTLNAIDDTPQTITSIPA